MMPPRTLASQWKPGSVPKQTSHKRLITHTHQTKMSRGMSRLVWQPTVDDTTAPRLSCDGRDRCCMFEADRMKPAASHVQAGRSAGQGISTVISSPKDVSCSKTATRSNTHHGHFVKHLHDHGITASTGLDGLDYRQFCAPDDFFPVSIFGHRLLHCLQKADSASSLPERKKVKIPISNLPLTSTSNTALVHQRA